ncbi:aminotransferase class I/II-fold pyridoxal phosphate-dependent enzyme [Candidatus Woesearchaeota archaeon]|nr:aminotransferase class I/II-fold pyridoxal phosphate-dependent enzyme [Candidatus Woesearchaeota archaeon]
MVNKELSPSMFIGVRGRGIISFGSGQPDLPPPKKVLACKAGYDDFKYGLIAGRRELRESLAQEFKKFKATKEDFIVTNGASESLDLAFRAICKPKDKILLHVPYYYSYKPLIEMNHFVPSFVKTNKGKIDIEDFEGKVHDVKAVLINSPSNPTGRLQDIKTLKIIEKVTQDLKIPLISDEVYKDLIYERENYMLSGSQVITINSFSKTFSMCGARVGYLYSKNSGIINKVIQLKTITSMNTNILAQRMAYHATKVPKSFIDSNVKIWKQRRDIIYERMLELGLDVWKPEGAFYILPKIKNPRKFVREMFKKHKVITYLGEWFGADDRVRFSYALDTKEIEEGLKRVGKYLKKN